jgi:hypothetical protein
VFKVFMVGKWVQVFNVICVSVEFMMLSGYNPLERTANNQILLAWNLKVFRLVYFDIFKSPAA